MILKILSLIPIFWIILIIANRFIENEKDGLYIAIGIFILVALALI